MKRKICFVLTAIITAAVLICGCSAGQKAEDIPKEEGSSADESVSSEQTDIKAEDDADKAVTPDLNRNGIKEEIRLSEKYGVPWLEIWENDEMVFSADGSVSSLFLCTLDGEEYLLRYQPTMYQGVCRYGYSLSTFADGEEILLRNNIVEFDINFGSPVHESFDTDSIAIFMYEINSLLSHSVTIMNANSDLMDTFEKEGRLYDSLWWLDNGWEPEFVRDKSKPLIGNLKDFKTAMTKGRELEILEEMDTLPIAEPMELSFYSGAGAWGTSIDLNPDGTFVGSYSDADGSIVYVCKFHGRFGKVEKITDNSWRMTLEELVIDTGRRVGEAWDEKAGGHTMSYISSEPHGFTDKDGVALSYGAQFMLYAPGATGHEPGTELYGAAEFQSWIHDRREFEDPGDTLGCWGLQNMTTGHGFFDDSKLVH